MGGCSSSSDDYDKETRKAAKAVGMSPMVYVNKIKTQQELDKKLKEHDAKGEIYLDYYSFS
jgi:hypothetical protein